MRYRHLGSLILGGEGLDGEALAELSDLHWDEDESILYAVSDQGWLIHLRPRFDGDVLSGLDRLAAYPLLSRKGNRLRGPQADSEGMAGRYSANGVRGDTRLYISFERHPRVVAYRPTGEHLESVPLPAPYASAKAYASANRGLEALADHPTVGLLTAPERPLVGTALRTNDPLQLTIAGIEAPQRRWTFRRYDTANSALIALAALPDGSLLTLERGYGWLYSPITIVLRQTEPLHPSTYSTGTRLDPMRTVAVLVSTEGWHLDNYEGLTHHQGMRFFMVSDDNASALQSTLLTYFEVVD